MSARKKSSRGRSALTILNASMDARTSANAAATDAAFVVSLLEREVEPSVRDLAIAVKALRCIANAPDGVPSRNVIGVARRALKDLLLAEAGPR